ncbi:MAG: malate dehydrogenase, partial [Candidatus Omnitrophica bacterium]|nr:malate dehydrogenase [Candidatus Omnitrophota bacterium]
PYCCRNQRNGGCDYFLYKMKLSIIGAGNVGGLLALRLLEFYSGELVLIDIAKDLASAKALDLEDSGAVYKYNYIIKGSPDIQEIKDSDIVIITAGFSRKPGMTREELLKKNSLIAKEIALKIRSLCPKAIVLVVTNPVDIITYLVLKISGFSPSRILGIGANLDTARFANLISKELNIPCAEIEAMVIGSHGEGMLPLARFTFIKGIPLNKFMDEESINRLIEATIKRGAQIVSLYGNSSAYFAPSAAISEVVKVILKDEHRTLGISAYLNGEYGIRDICIGVPCSLSKKGIERIIELGLNPQEKELFIKAAESIERQKEQLLQDAIL